MLFKPYDSNTLEKVHKINLLIYQDFADLCARHNINYFAISGTVIGALRHKGFIPWDDDIDIAMLRGDYERFVKYAETELSDKYYLMGPEFDHKYYNLKPHLVLKDTTFVTNEAWSSGYRPGFFLDLFIYDNIPTDPNELAKYHRQCKIYTVLWFAYHVHFEKLLDTQSTFLGKAKYIVSFLIGSFLRAIPGCEARIWRGYDALSKKYRGKTERYSALTDYGMTYMYVDKDEMFPLVDMPFENTSVKLVREYERQVSRHMGPDYMQLPPLEKRTNHFPKELDFGKYDEVLK